MKRPMTKQVRALVEQVNKTMAAGTLTENNKLFYVIEHFLIQNNMYYGFNFYTPDMKLINRPIEVETDIRQFYIR